MSCARPSRRGKRGVRPLFRAARARPAQQGTPVRLGTVESGMAALSVSVSFPINPFCHKVSKRIIYF